MHSVFQQKQKKEFINIMKTKFGDINIDNSDAYIFHSGIYGFTDQKHFAVLPLTKSEEKIPFFLMQSLENLDLSFIVLNSNMEFNGKVRQSPSLLLQKDIENIAARANIEIEHLKFGFLISVRYRDEKKIITANTMAPIFFNVETKEGWQEVLSDPHYNICQPMGDL